MPARPSDPAEAVVAASRAVSAAEVAARAGLDGPAARAVLAPLEQAQEALARALAGLAR